ncbi:unnamed protein product [Brachionus calyciflorus]|uniref:non-specific serine/threonine protein kinase n=1 Tax=Brachionus calyciflorus TaxID=104777 RepID=A0A813YQ37_9BILA|nr:unnamed protein product [Brachionus calyciflorus]
MGLQTSKINDLMVGDGLDMRYDIYKIKKLSGIEYFKCDDIADFNIKKTCEPVLVKDKRSQRVFQLINELNHPNIIAPHYFIDNGFFYVVRTYDDDYYAFAWRLQIQRHLQSYKKHIEIEEEQIIYWTKQLLTALACLHQNNVLHKFIIPEAISFKKDRLRLFIPASSEILELHDSVVEEKETWYKCPEHMNNKKIGLKYDIWSTGWALFNLCSLEDGRFILKDVEDFKSWKRPDIPRIYTRNLDRIFKMMTQYDPEERPSAQELLTEKIFN